LEREKIENQKKKEKRKERKKASVQNYYWLSRRYMRFLPKRNVTNLEDSRRLSNNFRATNKGEATLAK